MCAIYTFVLVLSYSGTMHWTLKGWGADTEYIFNDAVQWRKDFLYIRALDPVDVSLSHHRYNAAGLFFRQHCVMLKTHLHNEHEH